MSRLYGRINDVYNISRYMQENYHGKYKKDKTPTTGIELENAPALLVPYLTDDIIRYLDKLEINIAWNFFIKDTVYSGVGEEKNVIIFPNKTVQEEYKRDLIYFIGDLLRRLNLDYMPNEQDIRCQYSDVLPLLLEYLYLRECDQEERFSDKHLSDLNLNAKHYIRLYEIFKKYNKLLSEDTFLRNTLLYLVPLSSFDATLQISDEIANDKEALRSLISELIENPNHDREEVIAKRNIDTYGFKRLTKEIDRKNQRR